MLCKQVVHRIIHMHFIIQRVVEDILRLLARGFGRGCRARRVAGIQRLDSARILNCQLYMRFLDGG